MVPDLAVLTYMSPVCLSMLTLMLWKVYVFPSKTESMKSAHKTNFIVVDGSTSIASCICKFFFYLISSYLHVNSHFLATSRVTLLLCKLQSFVARITTPASNLSRNKFQCCKLQQHVARSRTRFYFWQQILMFDKSLAGVVIRATKLCNNVALQVARKFCPYYLAFRIASS